MLYLNCRDEISIYHWNIFTVNVYKVLKILNRLKAYLAFKILKILMSEIGLFLWKCNAFVILDFL